MKHNSFLKKSVLFGCSVLLSMSVTAQLGSCSEQSINAHWYFGEEAGVDFNDTPPTALTNGEIDAPYKASAVISDANGDLLFYTDGNTVYTSNHLPMQNGNGTLFGSGIYAQDVVIVPKPNDPNRYYIFYLQDVVTGVDRYYYSIVNMDANFGLGTVETLNVNLNLLPYFNTATFEIDANVYKHNMTVVKHNDCSSYWLVVNPFHKFFAYHITDAGIAAPVISDAEEDHFSNGNLETNSESTGGMKASQDGDLIGYATTILGNSTTNNPKLYLWNFDNTTGVITPNASATSSNFEFTGHSVEFSPNGDYLYATMGDAVLQYSTSNLNAGRYFVHESSVTSDTQHESNLQLGMDGKIYVSRVVSGGILQGQALSVINSPDQFGAGSNFTLNQLPLLGGVAGNALPQLVPCLCGAPTGTPPPCEGVGFVRIGHSSNMLSASFGALIKLAGGAYPVAYHWDFGDGNTSTDAFPMHTYTVDGKYTVCVTITFTNGTDQCTIVVCKDIKVNNLNGGSISIGAGREAGTAPMFGNENFDFEVYPNPTAGELTVVVSGAQRTTQVEVYSVDGKQVFATELNANNSANFNLSHLESGIYMIKVSNGTDSLTKQVVKTH